MRWPRRRQRAPDPAITWRRAGTAYYAVAYGYVVAILHPQSDGEQWLLVNAADADQWQEMSAPRLLRDESEWLHGATQVVRMIRASIGAVRSLSAIEQ